jgi:cell wall-associated NlpC family hydrolase
LRLRRFGTRVRYGVALGLALALASPAAALAAGGGLSSSAGGDEGAPATSTTPTPESSECAPLTGGLTEPSCAAVSPAVLLLGVAAPPEAAPPAVKAAIAAANRIRTKPYVWGGGHGRWWDEGYDCSGAVSYALHGAGLLEAPMDSGEMMDWGESGPGRWITVYANAGHAFAVIDGLRWDTAGDARGTGPRWHKSMAPTAGFLARHPAGY